MDNSKKITPGQMFRSGMKGKKTVNVDIVTQAENIISDYIYKRKNEIVNKYCKRHGKIRFVFLALTSFCVLGIMYFLLNK